MKITLKLCATVVIVGVTWIGIDYLSFLLNTPNTPFVIAGVVLSILLAAAFVYTFSAIWGAKKRIKKEEEAHEKEQ